MQYCSGAVTLAVMQRYFFFQYTFLYLLQVFRIQNYFLKLLKTRRYNSLLFCFRTYYSTTTVYFRQFTLIFLQPILQMRHKIEAPDAYGPNPAAFMHLFKLNHVRICSGLNVGND